MGVLFLSLEAFHGSLVDSFPIGKGGADRLERCVSARSQRFEDRLFDFLQASSPFRRGGFDGRPGVADEFVVFPENGCVVVSFHLFPWFLNGTW